MNLREEFDNVAALGLLGRIGQGDEKVFVRLFQMINRRVYLFALHRLGNPHDAEEVLNDTALELWRHPERFRGESRFMTYVLGIANNRASDRLRALGRIDEEALGEETEVASNIPSPPDLVNARQIRAAIGRCLGQLTPRQRVVVHLTYYEGLSRAEIGRIIGCEGNAVRQHLFQALRRLRSRVPRTYLE